MKNIHILPTDKPSRLVKHNVKHTYELLSGFIKSNPSYTTQHIYINSDEEIEEGVNQWYLDKFLNKPRNSSGSQYGEKQNVIILTTDQDLIVDGVQAIDDEFLQWFVKNPNCENVEFELDYDTDERIINGKNLGYYSYIIPKEEPNQIKCYCGHTTYCDCSPLEEAKQEELEEVAEKQWGNVHRTGVLGFIEGAKWEQERSYSEEDMFEFSQWISHEDWVYLPSKGYWVNEEQEELEQKLNSKEILNMWFEQFKKK